MELTPNWIVGFVDGDGSFLIQPSGPSKRFCFIVSQDKRSVNVLYAIKDFFKCGNVHKAGNNMRQYKVTNKKQLETLILPFFLRYSLQTVKWNDFKAVYEGVMKTPLTQPQKISITRDWLAGFTDAEGCFYTSMSKGHTLPYPRPQFLIGLHSRDALVLQEIQKFLGCGIIFTKKGKKNLTAVFKISNKAGFSVIIKTLLTSTNHCLLKTTKKISFLKFRQIINIIEKGEHLTAKGIEKIQKIITTV